jgi:glycosyltransferase involved in cell wall biosynthesis
MRVAWIPPHFEYGERVFFPPSFLLARRLAQKGLKTVIITPRAFHEASYEVIDGVEVFRSNDFALPLKLFHYPIPIRLYNKIMHVVRELNIDVLNWHGYHYLSAAWLPLIKRRLKIPCVLTVIGFPGVNWHYPVKAIDYISRIYTYSLGKIILKSADKVIIDSPQNAIGATKLGLAEGKLEYIPWGVDTELFKPIPEKRHEIRAGLGFEEDEFVVGYCGRLSPVKGIDPLLEAMKLLSEYNDKVRLLVIGGGGEGLGGDTYDKKARALLGDRVVMTGWVKPEQVPFYWQAADVAVQPSFAETSGIGAMEAAACGLPLVVSRTGGLQDTVNDGVTGFLVKPGDAKELCQKIKLSMENPDLRKEMGTSGRNYIKRNFGWDEIAEKYIEFYSTLIKK